MTSPPGAEEGRDGRQNVSQRDERHVDGDEVEAPCLGRKGVGRQRARVRAFEHDHARVGAQAPVELAVADVERDDAGGAVAQEDVGEASRRRTDVDARPSLDGDAEDARA